MRCEGWGAGGWVWGVGWGVCPASVGVGGWGEGLGRRGGGGGRGKGGICWATDPPFFPLPPHDHQVYLEQRTNLLEYSGAGVTLGLPNVTYTRIAQGN